MIRKVGIYNWRGNLDTILFAISSSTRRDILKRTTTGTYNIKKLSSHYKLTVATISKHVIILEKAQLIQKIRTGKGIVLLAIPGRLLMVKKYLDNYREFWKDVDKKTHKIRIT